MTDLNKKPKKGILKNSSSFDGAHDKNRRPSKTDKETKWDEMNIIATLHPADKDYGHMKIEEPKTPFNYIDPDKLDVVDAKELAERIMQKSKELPKVLQEESDGESESDEDLTPEAKEKKKQFENKRKQHYNEYYAVKLARKLLEEEDEDDDDEEHDEKNKPSSSRSRSNSPKGKK